MRVHAHTDCAIVVEITGAPRQGTFYLSNAKSPKDLEDRQRRLAEEFEQIIKRHIEPHFSGEFVLRQRVQRVFQCSACQAAWTEESDTYNGGCCAEDEKHNPEAAEQTATPITAE